MRHIYILIIYLIVAASCTSRRELAYLGNLPEAEKEQTFTSERPDYRLQSRDILYVTVKAMTSDGYITDFLSTIRGTSSSNFMQTESGGYIYGFDVNSEGYIELPAAGKIKVAGLTVEQARKQIQDSTDRVFRNSTVECKLLSFKFTVIGEVRSPGTYINYNNYLTVLEAIGRAGGLTEYGRRDRILVVRPFNEGSKTYTLSLSDKNILSSEAYYLMPNDVVIVQEGKGKIFNLNLPTYSFILTSVTSAITTTLLLINYFGR